MRAVVLGGGGARGPYHIGVWQALDELSVGYQIVTGTSVGAINGALMVQDDYRLARRMWETLTTKDVISEAPDTADSRGMLSLLRYASAQGGMDVTPLEKTVRSIIDEEKIRSSGIELGIVTTRLPEIRPMQLVREDIPQGEMADYLLASAACFPFFKQKDIGGVRYIDGAYFDNLPVDLAVRCGAEEIVAVNLHGLGVVHSYKHENIPITYIHSHWDLGEMFQFEPETASRNMRLGYQDAMRAYRRLEGRYYAFPPGETSRNAKMLREAFGFVRRRTHVDLFRQNDRLPFIREAMEKTDRFLPRTPDKKVTLGCSVTTAAEYTAEILGIRPDEIYSFGRFNRLILEKSAFLRAERYPVEEDGPKSKPEFSKMALLRLYRYLRRAFDGRLFDSSWGVAAMFQREFIAAYYILALEAYVENL